VIAEHDDDLELKDDDLDGKEKKPRRKHNRFNGLAEEEVMKRLLPDLICPNLDILIVSIYPLLLPTYSLYSLVLYTPCIPLSSPVYSLYSLVLSCILLVFPCPIILLVFPCLIYSLYSLSSPIYSLYSLVLSCILLVFPCPLYSLYSLVLSCILLVIPCLIYC